MKMQTLFNNSFDEGVDAKTHYIGSNETTSFKSFQGDFIGRA
jgi:hypothetical protein